MYDIIIIGAGPAGMTAAVYARRASKTVLLLEAKSYGGQIINTPDIENFPAAAHISGVEFAQKLYEQAAALGAEFKFEKAVDIEVSEDGSEKTVVTPKNRYTAKTVIIATGSENRKLGVEGEDKLIGRGVSYCATCDGAFYKGKTAVVVGGGNTALEDALYLADLAAKVYLIHRRDEFRGEQSTAEKLKAHPNVEIIYNSTVTKLIADKKLTAVEVTDKDGSVRTIETNGLFVAVGRVPENENFGKLVELDGSGYIKAGEDCKTNVPGIYAAGDNRVKTVRQLVTAAADGACAVSEALKILNEQ